MSSLDSFDADPFTQFEKWYHHAERRGPLRRLLTSIYPPAVIHQPDAMTLATATKDGKSSARIVLLKGFSQDGFVFYTNYLSRKGREIDENPQAAIVFHWAFPERQVRAEGWLAKISPDDSGAYWKTRPRGSQLSGAASEQSATIPSRELLKKAVAALADKYRGKDIPRPEFWGGYCLHPEQIEFWEGRADRLHDRVRYLRSASGWERALLAP
jgi:pyridoxamine 5'-phosphate oxidase